MKPKIVGMGNEGKTFSYVIFRKKKGFYPWLAGFLVETIDYGGPLGNEGMPSKGYQPKGAQEPLTCVDQIDVHHVYYGEGRVDIFFGSKKIFMTFLGTPTQHKKMMTYLEKNASF